MKFNLTWTSGSGLGRMETKEIHTLEGLLAFALDEGHDVILSKPQEQYGRGDNSLWSIEVYDGYRE